MSPPFVAVDPFIADNKKTWALAERLQAAFANGSHLFANSSGGVLDGDSALTLAIGHVVRVLGAVMQQAPSGDLSNVPPGLLERWAGWHGVPNVFDEAFRSIYVQDGKLAGWVERNGGMLKRRDDARDRMRASRERKRTVREQEANGAPNVRANPNPYPHHKEKGARPRARDEAARTAAPSVPAGPPAPAPRQIHPEILREMSKHTPRGKT